MSAEILGSNREVITQLADSFLQDEAFHSQREPFSALYFYRPSPDLRGLHAKLLPPHINQLIKEHEDLVSGPEIQVHIRRRSVEIPLGDGWPPLGTQATQWFYSGTLHIAGNPIELEPPGVASSVSLAYPLTDGTRTDLIIRYTLYPFEDEVVPHSRAMFGDDSRGIPHIPFSDKPELPSFLMQKALESMTSSQV